ncbi:MAG: phosphate ABC transporter substrate-binding protein PstS [Mycobacteriales bacterium]
MSRRLRTLPLVAVSVTAALLLAGCSSSSKTPPATGSTTPAASAAAALTETGSTLLFPLFNLWAPAYHQLYPNVSITTAGTGSGTGISQAAAGAVSIGASDAYLSHTQVSKYPGLENIPLAISAQQINYNLPGIAGHVKLNGAVLSAIYQGKITKWNAPAITAINPGLSLPNLPIVPLHRSDGSGDTFIFTQYLSKADPSGWGASVGFGTTVSFPSVPGALGENGNGGMVSGCAATPGCVAYIGISFLHQTESKGLGEALLGNASGNYLLPTPTTIQAEAASFTSQTPANEALSLVYGPSAGAYPIINYEYAIVSTTQSSASTAAAIRAFLTWCLTQGNAASFLTQVQFQPLPASVVTLSEAQIAKIGG